jgi:transcriptional regulator with XRE-family HTH domain
MRIKHELLRSLRLGRGLTQQEVADEIEIDIRTYRKYESGDVNNGAADPVRASQYETLRGLAALFGLASPNELVDLAAAEAPPFQPSGTKGSAAAGAPQARLPPPGAAFQRAFYVHREKEEKKALTRLQSAGVPVVLQGPERYGCSTLLSYLLSQLTRPEEYKGPLLRINLHRLDESCFTSLDSLLRGLCHRLLSLLDMHDADEAVQRIWQRPGSAKSKLSWAMEQYVLPSHARVLLALEHADRLLGCAFHNDFFSLLRGWVESCTQAPWSALRLLVTVSTEPILLESIDHSAFFALAPPIRIDELSPAQVARLAALYGYTPAEQTLARLIELVGGHPYLLRLTLSEAHEQGVGLDELVDHLGQEGLGHADGLFTSHLHQLRKTLEGQKELLTALASVLDNPAGPLNFTDYCALYSKGLLLEQEPGLYRVRCKLYADYFRTLCRKRA